MKPYLLILISFFLVLSFYIIVYYVNVPIKYWGDRNLDPTHDRAYLIEIKNWND